MTNEEIICDIGRFEAYLEANGVRVLAHAINTEQNGTSQSFSLGGKEMTKIEQLREQLKRHEHLLLEEGKELLVLVEMHTMRSKKQTH